GRRGRRRSQGGATQAGNVVDDVCPHIEVEAQLRPAGAPAGPGRRDWAATSSSTRARISKSTLTPAGGDAGGPRETQLRPATSSSTRARTSNSKLNSGRRGRRRSQGDATQAGNVVVDACPHIELEAQL